MLSSLIYFLKLFTLIYEQYFRRQIKLDWQIVFAIVAHYNDYPVRTMKSVYKKKKKTFIILRMK